MKADPRYTSNTVFDSFPWPQSPTPGQVEAVARTAVALRAARSDLRVQHSLTLRELYRSIEEGGDHPMEAPTAALDQAVRRAYGMAPDEDVLAFLLSLNKSLADEEAAGREVVGPGLPPTTRDRSRFITSDRITMRGDPEAQPAPQPVHARLAVQGR